MISEKQKEALKIILELHGGNKMTDEQVLTVIEALADNTPSVQFVPWTMDNIITQPELPWYLTNLSSESITT